MNTIPNFLSRSPLALATLVLLAACGGGGDDTPAAPPPGEAATPLGSAGAGGRAQALAATLPPLSPAPVAASGNVRCANQALGAVSVDNVEVPAGTACRLTGTTVRGSVQAAPGAIVEARDVVVGGAVQGERAAHVLLEGSATRVAGGVQLQGGGGATIIGVRVSGDVQLEDLDDLVLVRDTQVAGNLQLNGGRGGAEIRANRITGNLQCSGNLPAPLAEANTAAAFEDQCLGGAAPGGGGGGGSGGGGGGGGTPPLSGNVVCNGLTIGALALDSVVVPPGARCTLVGTRLIGSLEVGAGAQLAADAVQVGGNLVAQGAAAVGVSGASRFGGSVQVADGGSLALAGATITGDLQIDAMAGAVTAADNRIAGSLQAQANLGGVVLMGNRITGNLQCQGNRPAPTGSGNAAAQKQEQCRGL